MKIVIDLPKEEYEEIINSEDCGLHRLTRAIAKGTPLPKGHGRLIDANAFLKDNDDYTGWILFSKAWGGENGYKDTLEDLVAEAQTIIEADTESEG